MGFVVRCLTCAQHSKKMKTCNVNDPPSDILSLNQHADDRLFFKLLFRLGSSKYIRMKIVFDIWPMSHFELSHQNFRQISDVESSTLVGRKMDAKVNEF